MASILSHGYKKRALSSVVGTTRYTDEYTVRCEPGVTQKQILDYFRAMKIAPGYLGDSAMVCTDVSASTSVLDGQLWTVTSKYESVSYATGGLGDYSTPLDEPWRVRDGKTTLSQVISKAYAGWVDGQTEGSPSSTPNTKIVNTAGDPFDPPMMQDIILPTIELSKNMSVAEYTSLLGLLLDDTVNASATTVAGHVIPKWGGKINVEGTTATYANPANGNPVTYMQARILVTIHPQTWVRFILNVGYRAIDSTSGQLIRVQEKGYGNKRADVPVKLDVNGAVLEDETEGSGYWLAFLTYLPKSWAGANLPSSLSNL